MVLRFLMKPNKGECVGLVVKCQTLVQKVDVELLELKGSVTLRRKDTSPKRHFAECDTSPK